MQNTKKRSRKAQDKANAGLESIKNFYSFFNVNDAQELLWDQFQHSMICAERNDMTPEDRREHFFFYNLLKNLIISSSKLTGL